MSTTLPYKEDIQWTVWLDTQKQRIHRLLSSRKEKIETTEILLSHLRHLVQLPELYRDMSIYIFFKSTSSTETEDIILTVLCICHWREHQYDGKCCQYTQHHFSAAKIHDGQLSSPHRNQTSNLLFCLCFLLPLPLADFWFTRDRSMPSTRLG